jgi:predicted alpha/beta superfamily hydrolase
MQGSSCLSCPCPGYHDPANAQLRYPVVYMHDGQNCLYPALSFTGVDWGVDAAVAQLVAAGRLRLPPICVLIWNRQQQRRQEYMPAGVAPLGLRAA